MEKRQKLNRHSVVVKFLATIMVVLIIVAGVMLAGLRIYSNQFKMLYENRKKEQQQTFSLIKEQFSEPQKTLSVDYTYWDDMVDFVKTGDPTWAEENIDPGLTTYNCNVIWVFDTKGKEVYSINDVNEDGKHFAFNLQPKEMQELFKNSEKGLVHYFTAIDGHIIEIHGATVHPTADDERKTPAKGYFLVGRLIDETYAQSLSELSISSVTVLNSSASPDQYRTDFEVSSGKIAFAEDLKDHDDKVAGKLYVTYNIVSIQQVYKVLTAILAFTIFASLSAGILFVALFYVWVRLPLKKISRALYDNSAENLAKLMDKPDEFGQISSLIGQYFVQEQILINEKQLVEQKVEERTKELREEQAKLRGSIESLDMGYLLLNCDSQAVLQNISFRNMFELKAPIQYLNDLDRVVPGYDFAAAIKKCSDERKPIELKALSWGPKILYFYISPIYTFDNNEKSIVGTVIVVRDITESKILERSKDEFLSIASHELRTPLTSIKGNTSMIMQYYPDLLKDKNVSEMIQDVHASSVRLISIVNDFLDLSRLEQGKIVYRMQEVKADEIIEKVLYELKQTINNDDLHIEYDHKTLDHLPTVWADPDRLKQILYNIVGNAVKFTEKGSINIGAQADDKSLKITVQDTGRGIPIEDQKLLFHKFQQTGKSLLTRDTTRGTGLGLYISKKNLEDMGGQIKLEHSESGVGSLFSAIIPLSTGERIQPSTHGVAVVDVNTGMTTQAEAPDNHSNQNQEEQTNG